MSGYPNPNNFNQQNYYAQQGSNGTGSPSLNPQMLMAATAGTGIRPQIPFNPGMANGSPSLNSAQMTPAQLQRLAEFHNRQQAQPQPQQVLAQYQQQPVRPPQPAYTPQSQNRNPVLGQQRPLPGTAQQQQQAAIQHAINLRNNCIANGTPVPPAIHQYLQAAAAQGLLPQRPSLPSSQPSQPPQQQTQPHIPITQAQQSIRPALLAAAIAARASQSLSPALPPAPPLPAQPVGVPPSALSRPPIVPITKAFTPPPRTPSPAKEITEPAPPTVPSAGVEAVKTEADVAQEKPKPKKKRAKPKDKEKEKEGEKGQDSEKEKEKEKEKDAEEVKPKKPRPKKPRAKKDKDKVKETTPSTATATESASAVYFAAVEPTLKDTAAAQVPDKAALASVESGKEERPELPTTRFVERKSSPVRPAQVASAAAAPSAPSAHAPVAHAQNAAPEVRRRREEGMRGSMRNEIARLMYGAGDVVEPDIDTVDYMEDLVTDFLAELSRPIPPLRSGPGAAHQPIPLSFDIVRHRLLSTPHMSKYLERFDHMVHMSDVLKAHRRIANPNMSDLVEQVGNDYLGLDDDAEAANGEGEARQNRNRKRVGATEDDGRPKKKGRPVKNPGERKKPGPQKGWKLNREPGVGTPPSYRRSGFKDPNAPKRKYVRKSVGAGGVGVGVKRDPSVV